MSQYIDVKEIIKGLHDRIKNRRRYLKISQEKLGEMIGASRFKVMNGEKGKAEYTLEEYLKCCIVLDIPFNCLDNE